MANFDSSIRITAEKMKSEFYRILISLGFSESRADECAEIFMINSLEGVYSHGINRFPRFVGNIKEGFIIPEAVPTLEHKTGSLEQWKGNLGPGPLNAMFATDRAADLARENGIGMVAMANTNHWMRGGTYGWHAARKGFVFLCWTNTCANMPAWGATDPRLGNNPFVIAVPYQNDAIVLDFAMTQFSYGKMENYLHEGKQLPFPGGFNKEGDLTTDPGEVLETFRALPIGYWKGAGLSLFLDILATVLSGGRATHEVNECKSEYDISQVFIAVDLKSLKNFPAIDNSIKLILEDLQNSNPENETTKIHYPSENVAKIRYSNLKEGIPVNKDIWDKILSL